MPVRVEYSMLSEQVQPTQFEYTVSGMGSLVDRTGLRYSTAFIEPPPMPGNQRVNEYPRYDTVHEPII